MTVCVSETSSLSRNSKKYIQFVLKHFHDIFSFSPSEEVELFCTAGEKKAFLHNNPKNKNKKRKEEEEFQVKIFFTFLFRRRK